MDDDEFADIFASVDSVAGWLTRDQAWMLFSEARRLPPSAQVVEIGSHQGRSTTALAAGLSSGRVIAVDPFTTTRRYAGPSVQALLESNLRQSGLLERVEVIPKRSSTVRATWTAPVDLLFVDGKHDMFSCVDDLRWRRFLSSGDRVLVHDAFSSIGVTLAILVAVLPARNLAFVDRTGSLARFEVRRPTGRDRVRILRQLPWWIRNVAMKVLLRLRLFRIAKTLGHEHPDVDPY